MSDKQTLERVRELERVIERLASVRDSVGGFSVSAYETAGAGLWAGEKRKRFAEGIETVRSSHGRISDEISQAISDCKSKQRHLAFSINAAEHPLLSIEAITIALN